MPRRAIAADESDQEEDQPRRQRAGSGGGGQQDLANLELSDPLKTCRHLFLQSLIARRVVRKELAEQLYKDCIKLCKVEDAPEMQDFMDSIEGGLNMIGFEVRQARDQETGKIVYIFANTVQDTAAKLATEYKAEEIAFFKAIVAKIMLARELSYCVSQAEAVKEAKPPITRVFAIQLVKSFLAKDWLSLHPSSGRLVLSPRSLTELAPYLRETFADEDDEDVEPRDRVVVYCNYCTKIVTSGYACPNRHCGVRLHTFCAAATIGNSNQCPDRLTNNENPCPQLWKRDAKTQKPIGHPVGVAALRLGDEDGAHPTSQMSEDEEQGTPAASKKKKKTVAAKGKGKGGKASAKGKGKGKKKQDSDDEDELMDDGDEDDDEDEDEDDGSAAAPSSARRSSRRSSATTSKRRTIQPPTSEDEGDDDEE